jgi:hypothetical protein
MTPLEIRKLAGAISLKLVLSGDMSRKQSLAKLRAALSGFEDGREKDSLDSSPGK